MIPQARVAEWQTQWTQNPPGATPCEFDSRLGHSPDHCRPTIALALTFTTTTAEPVRDGVPILMYHELTARPHPGFRRYSVSPGRFRAQMRFLARRKYHAVSLSTLAAWREAGTMPPARTVAITFDDGFRSCVEVAGPILKKFGFSATFFIVAGEVGACSSWLTGELGIELPLADWSALRNLVADGHECGAHSLTHPRLPELPADRCRVELVESKRTLEAHLGGEIAHLAYPYGAQTAGVRTLARQAGYRTACSTMAGLSGPADDPYALRRVEVTGGDTLLDFACRLRTAEAAGVVLRRRTLRMWRAAFRVGTAARSGRQMPPPTARGRAS
jgi:peptidoglycan/xylan/chitin deacetylase (PgdA/CDA1 family)